MSTEFFPESNSSQFTPIEGEAFSEFMKLAEQQVASEDPLQQEKALEIIRKNAFTMLSLCRKNSGEDEERDDNGIGLTNLHVADVQSGKTMAMCALIALAYDNNFSLVTVLTGTKNILKEQSSDRIKEYLNKIDPNNRKFQIISVASMHTPEHLSGVIKSIGRRRKYTNPKMLVFTSLKETKNILKLTRLFESENICKMDINSIMLDDEADQASLNTKAASFGRSSSTYSAILQLRSAHSKYHTFFQITATAQALFCIPEDDPLSPEFVSLSERNDNYIGISTYFGSRQSRDLHVKVIDESDLPSVESEDFPESLNEAIEYFILAVSILRYFGEEKQLSMLCHPDSLQATHENYRVMISNKVACLQRLLSDEASETILFEQLLEHYDEALKAIPSELRPTRDALKKYIGQTLEDPINIACINTRNQVNDLDSFWQQQNHILIGGASIERGFTVKGILVTYLCRTTGKNSDTIQQRARFCGYKSHNHLLLSRLWLDQENIDFFTNYIVTETSIRAGLKANIDKRKPFLKAGFSMTLYQGYRPTRINVHSELNTYKLSGWFTPQLSQFNSPENHESNTRMLTGVITDLGASLIRDEKTWRCFRSDALTIYDLKKLLKNFKCVFDDMPRLSLIKSVIDSFDQYFLDQDKILTCLLCNAKVPENESYLHYLQSGNSNTNPDFLVYNREFKLKERPVEGDHFDCSTYRINLQRGRDKSDQSQVNYLSDIDMHDPNRVTMHINIVNYSINERSFGKYGDNEQGRRLSNLCYRGQTAVMHVKLPGISRWTAFRQ